MVAGVISTGVVDGNVTTDADWVVGVTNSEIGMYARVVCWKTFGERIKALGPWPVGEANVKVGIGLGSLCTVCNPACRCPSGVIGVDGRTCSITGVTGRNWHGSSSIVGVEEYIFPFRRRIKYVLQHVVVPTLTATTI